MYFKDFHSPFYETFDCFWSMNNIPRLVKALFAVKDDKMRKICGEVIQAFVSDVVPSKSDFRKGCSCLITLTFMMCTLTDYYKNRVSQHTRLTPCARSEIKNSLFM